MPKLYTNGIEIEYSIEGQGEPLVLIAGLGYSRWCWHRVIPELAKHYQVISFDNRGVGGTTRTEGPYTAELLADDTAALLDALKIKKANIAGISMGGFIAQALVIRRPDLFKRMILIATGFGGSQQISPSQEIIEKLKDTTMDIRARALLSCAPGFENKDKDFFEYWMDYRASNPVHPDGYNSQLAIGLKLIKENFSFVEGLKKVSTPTLILFGELDALIPSGNAYLLEKAIPNSQAVVLPDVGHFLTFEHPAAVISEISRFLQQEDRTKESEHLSHTENVL